MSTYTGVTNCQKPSGFLAHPVCVRFFSAGTSCDVVNFISDLLTLKLWHLQRPVMELVMMHQPEKPFSASKQC